MTHKNTEILASLRRRLGDVARPRASDREIIVATGPLPIMAAGYLALEPDHRAAFSVQIRGGTIDPATLPEIVRQWEMRLFR